MFDWLYDILGVMMSFFNTITGSYALALLLYALVFKIVFLPFSIKQQKNQIKLAKLTPKIELIKAKYKGRTDPASMQRQQEEIMELQQKEGYSAFSGCLPLLIQLPIIMLLYAVIQNPLSYIANRTPVVDDYNAHYSDPTYETPAEIVEAFGDSIYKVDDDNVIVKDKDGNPVRVAINPVEALYKHFGLTEAKDKNEIALINKIYTNTHNADGSEIPLQIAAVEGFGIEYKSVPDFRVFGVNLAENPSFLTPSILIVIPFLAAAASWLSMWLMRKFNNTGVVGSQDEQTQASLKIMDLIMPLMTVFIAFNFSGMLGLYWVYQSLLGLGQSFIIAKAMPIPRYTEEELKEMRRAQREAEKAARAAAKTTRHRSLHYIDEDDYEELPDAPGGDEGGKTGGGFSSTGAPEIKD